MKPIILAKIKEVETLAERIKSSSSVVTVDYRGLTVAEVTELRNKLREEGCEFKVIKNNILRRAFQAIEQNEIADLMVGPNAIIFSGEDAISPAKICSDFAKSHKALEVKAGIIDNGFLDAAGVAAIASIPGREGLLTMLAGSMLAPLRDLTIGLHLYTEEKED